MTQPAILDLLNGGFSPVEIEHGGQSLWAFNVEVEEEGKKPDIIPILAADSVDAINRAFDLMFPDWDVKKPASGLSIKVIAFDRRSA